MSEMLVWVVGGGGLLGSHLRRALRRHVPNARVWESTPPHLSWTDATKLTTELDGAVAAFADAVRRGADTWSVLWCAGRGVMSSTPEALEPEWSAWKQLLELLGYHLPGSKEEVYGSIFLASSAGGVYGSNVGQNLTEHTPNSASFALWRAQGPHGRSTPELVGCFSAPFLSDRQNIEPLWARAGP